MRILFEPINIDNVCRRIDLREGKLQSVVMSEFMLAHDLIRDSRGRTVIVVCLIEKNILCGNFKN